MKKRLVIGAVIFIILIAGVLGYYGFGKRSVCISGNCFDVEIAETPNELRKGLMNRESLEKSKGMFFIFNESDKHGFWMKDTEIPLDIIWINSDMEVVDVEHSAKPCEGMVCKTYEPEESSTYVLEINSGLADEYDIRKGQNVKTTNVV
ncbi:MAG: DUF192 domain-containing protein [Candidatus Pacearchaeota archaeon]